jgi:hypothetical protein
MNDLADLRLQPRHALGLVFVVEFRSGLGKAFSILPPVPESRLDNSQ